MTTWKLKNQVAPEKDAGRNSPIACADSKIGRQPARKGIADVVPVHVGNAVEHDEGWDDAIPPPVRDSVRHAASSSGFLRTVGRSTKPAILIRTIESRSIGSVSWIAADEAADGLSRKISRRACLIR